MADERKIVIEIVSKNENTSPIKSDGTVNSNIQGALTPTENENSQKNELFGAVLATQAYQAVKKIVLESVNNSINKGFYLKENYMAENDYRMIVSTISKVSGFAMSVAGGFAVGNAVGAAIGAVSYVGGEIVSGFNNYSSYYESLNATNYQNQFMRTRAGLVDNGRGTEN